MKIKTTTVNCAVLSMSVGSVLQAASFYCKIFVLIFLPVTELQLLYQAEMYIIGNKEKLIPKIGRTFVNIQLLVLMVKESGVKMPLFHFCY